MSKLRPLLIFGPRPEAIKMAPVVLECRRRREAISPIVCVSGQHRELLALPACIRLLFQRVGVTQS